MHRDIPQNKSRHSRFRHKRSFQGNLSFQYTTKHKPLNIFLLLNTATGTKGSTSQVSKLKRSFCNVERETLTLCLWGNNPTVVLYSLEENKKCEKQLNIWKWTKTLENIDSASSPALTLLVHVSFFPTVSVLALKTILSVIFLKDLTHVNGSTFVSWSCAPYIKTWL